MGSLWLQENNHFSDNIIMILSFFFFFVVVYVTWQHGWNKRFSSTRMWIFPLQATLFVTQWKDGKGYYIIEVPIKYILFYYNENIFFCMSLLCVVKDDVGYVAWHCSGCVMLLSLWWNRNHKITINFNFYCAIFYDLLTDNFEFNFMIFFLLICSQNLLSSLLCHCYDFVVMAFERNVRCDDAYFICVLDC